MISRVKRKYFKFRLLFWLALVFIFLTIGVLVAYTQEKAVTPNITIIDILENTIVAMLGEYPDKPHSLIARGLQLVWFVFSVVIFGVVVGKISSIFVTYSLKQGNRMKEFKSHIVICNWNQRAEEIIRQLFESHVNNSLDVVVVSASPIDEIDLPDDCKEHFHFVHSDPTQHSVLSSVNVQKAKSIVILADEKSESPDDKSVLIALAVKHLETALDKDLHVVAELININRKRHLQDAGADEIVCSMSYSSGIIAQSALFKNMSEIYQRLLSYSSDTNEIYFVPPEQYSKEYLGMDFTSISSAINDKRKAKDESPVLLLGVKHKGKILLNPRPSEFTGLLEDDSLIIMAFQSVKEV
jgi:voltage-gated potassium channel